MQNKLYVAGVRTTEEYIDIELLYKQQANGQLTRLMYNEGEQKLDVADYATSDILAITYVPKFKEYLMDKRGKEPTNEELNRYGNQINIQEVEIEREDETQELRKKQIIIGDLLGIGTEIPSQSLVGNDFYTTIHLLQEAEADERYIVVNARFIQCDDSVQVQLGDVYELALTQPPAKRAKKVNKEEQETIHKHIGETAQEVIEVLQDMLLCRNILQNSQLEAKAKAKAKAEAGTAEAGTEEAKQPSEPQTREVDNGQS